MKLSPILLITMAVLTMSACQTTRVYVPTQGQWSATILNGQSLTSPLPTLKFNDDQRISGFSGCNRYSAGIVATANQIYITDAISTKMMCSESESATEQHYLTTLSRMTSIVISDNIMTMQSPSGEEIQFEKLD